MSPPSAVVPSGCPTLPGGASVAVQSLGIWKFSKQPEEAKQFIRPNPSTFADEQAFAFRHVLIRDAAYAAILKRRRAELHERFASWLEPVTGERITEYREIVGYHLERAYH